MIKSLQKLQRQDKERFVVPKSVQQSIPIRRIWPDGIFQVGNKFSKSIRFADINYAIASKEDKTEMLLDYSQLLNALDAGSTAKITIHNKRVNKTAFEQSVLFQKQNDGLDGYRDEYNQALMSKISSSSNSIVQERYKRKQVRVTKTKDLNLDNWDSTKPRFQGGCLWGLKICIPHRNEENRGSTSSILLHETE